MSNNLSAYVVFNGNAREALEFWQSVFGGEVRISTFGDFGVTDMDPALVMHGQLTTPAGYTIMAADSTRPGDEVVRGGMTLCLWGDDVETMTGYFDALAEGGTVTTPLAKQVWGDLYGDVIDRFGITWGFNLADDTEDSVPA